MPSADVPFGTDLFSIKTVIRAQFSSSVAWLGQQSEAAGNLGGATRRERSRLRQSPRGKHGGDKQLSCNAGTHTSCDSHVEVELLFKQLVKPHQIFEHFASPLRQTHELQLLSSKSLVTLLLLLLLLETISALIALYGDSVDVFKHADAGSDNTGEAKYTVCS